MLSPLLPLHYSVHNTAYGVGKPIHWVGYQNPEPFVWLVLIQQVPEIKINRADIRNLVNQNKSNKKFWILVSLSVYQITFHTNLLVYFKAYWHMYKKATYLTKLTALKKILRGNKNVQTLYLTASSIRTFAPFFG